MSIVCYSMQVSDGARHSSTGILLILAASQVSIFQGWWRCPDLHRCRQSQQRTCLLVACQEKKTRPITQSLLMCRHHTWFTVNVGYLSSWTRWAVMRAPEAPSGCPMAIAPPLTLLFSGSRPRAFATARYWGAKASFTWAKKMTSMMQLSNNYPDKSKHKRNAVTKIKSQRLVTNLHKIHVVESQTSFFKSFCDCWNRT